MFGSYLRPLPPILNLANYPCHLLAILSWYGLARSAMVALRIVWSTLPKRLDVHKRLQKWPRPGKSGGREYYLVFRAINFPFDLGVSTWFVAATKKQKKNKKNNNKSFTLQHKKNQKHESHSSATTTTATATTTTTTALRGEALRPPPSPPLPALWTAARSQHVIYPATRTAQHLARIAGLVRSMLADQREYQEFI